MSTPQDHTQTRRRLTTAFGWMAGGALGLTLNYAGFALVGEGYPVIPTTFAAFILGAFGGMAVADHYGPRAFRPLGLAAGVLLALLVVVALLVMLGHR